MSLRLVVCALAIFLASVFASSHCEAKSKRKASIGSVSERSSRSSGSRTSTSRARKSRDKSRHESRKKRRSRSRADNMPKGWTWPPSARMREAGKACLADLDALGIRWEKAPSVRKVATPITLDAMELGGVKLVSTYRKGPFVMDCQLALGLAHFAETLYGLGVREVQFSRIHDYTQVRVNGTVKQALSRHALGVAIDMRAFVDETGRKAVVLDDYPLGDELLLAIERALNESGGFRTVLTPSNDPASHDDHFHAEVQVDYARTTHTSSL